MTSSVFIDPLCNHGWHLGPSCHLFVAHGTDLEILHAFAASIGESWATCDTRILIPSHPSILDALTWLRSDAGRAAVDAKGETMKTIEEDLEFEEVYRQVRENRQNKECAARQDRYKLLSIDDPHAMDEFRSLLGAILSVPTGMQNDWRERILDALKHAHAERDDLVSRLRRIRDAADAQLHGKVIQICDERFPPYDAFEWNGCQKDAAEAHRIIAARKGKP